MLSRTSIFLLTKHCMVDGSITSAQLTNTALPKKNKNRLHFLSRKLKAMERDKNEMPELRSITDLTDIPMKLTSWGKRFPAERQIWPKCSFLGRSYQISVISDSMLEI